VALAAEVKRSDSAANDSVAAKKFHGQLKYDATFCPTDVDDPFDTVRWDIRTEDDQSEDEETAVAGRPRRERLPDTRQSITHKFTITGHEGYVTAGLFEDGRPGELFITMAKEGSTIGGLMNAFGIAVSMSLQYGVPLEDYVRKFTHMRFEPQGHTKNADIRMAKSVIDYIFRWLGITFLRNYEEPNLNLIPKECLDDKDQPLGGENDLTELRPVDRNSDHQVEAQLEDGGEVWGVGGQSLETTLTTCHANGQDKLQGRTGVMLGDDETSRRDRLLASLQADAPSCDNCGSITVRNGRCYLCYHCGESSSCS